MKTRVPVLLAVLVMSGGAVEAAYKIGDYISNFTRTEAYGSQVSLHDYLNWVVVLTFWTPT